MFLEDDMAALRVGCFPRIRGDVPVARVDFDVFPPFSPHTRGCSGSAGETAGAKLVFPAYAGMFLGGEFDCVLGFCFPRIRGDVPTRWNARRSSPGFSPHTRGCSAGHHTHDYLLIVFPAYAGMFLERRRFFSPSTCFPRIRGDVPVLVTLSFSEDRFSPHTRGCSHIHPQNNLAESVFPAYAGMFRRPRPRGH